MKADARMKVIAQPLVGDVQEPFARLRIAVPIGLEAIDAVVRPDVKLLVRAIVDEPPAISLRA